MVSADAPQAIGPLSCVHDHVQPLSDATIPPNSEQTVIAKDRIFSMALSQEPATGTRARTRTKICGIRDTHMALIAVHHGADAIGLVFQPDSPRHVTLDQARNAIRALPAFVEPVGLFVDRPADEIKQVAQDVGLRCVQLHGAESLELAAQLAPLRVIKALAFDSPEQALNDVQPWRDAVPNLVAILWDAPRATTTDRTDTGRIRLPDGGSGTTYDWNALAELVRSDGSGQMPPMVLAGGLNPQNVGQAIETVRPYAVDVSSGVESERGIKNADLIRDFCQAVQRADASRLRKSLASPNRDR